MLKSCRRQQFLILHTFSELTWTNLLDDSLTGTFGLAVILPIVCYNFRLNMNGKCQAKSKPQYSAGVRVLSEMPP